ncbi:MAG: VOC family protein [Nocardioides sp.]
MKEWEAAWIGHGRGGERWLPGTSSEHKMPHETMPTMDPQHPTAEPLLRMVDAVTVAVPDLDSGLEFYAGRLRHELLWRNDALGQAGLRCPDSETEIVISAGLPTEPNWLVESADAAAGVIVSAGGRMISPPADIPVGRVAVVADPFGNRLVLVDLSKGSYCTDHTGAVIDVAPK